MRILVPLLYITLAAAGHASQTQLAWPELESKKLIILKIAKIAKIAKMAKIAKITSF